MIRRISDFQRIEYMKMKVGYPYSFIDFVYRVTFSILQEPRSLFIRMASVDTENVPLPIDTARGEVINSYDALRELAPNETEVVIEMGLDPKDAFPSWQSQKTVVEWFTHTIQNFKALVEDPHFKVTQGVLDYIKAHDL